MLESRIAPIKDLSLKSDFVVLVDDILLTRRFIVDLNESVLVAEEAGTMVRTHTLSF